VSRRAVTSILLVLLLFGGTASVVQAELVSSGNLFVNFNGGVVPSALPRHRPAPIEVRISGKVRTLTGVNPPSLTTITVSLNRKGRFDTWGLPRCRMKDLVLATSSEALEACSDARVGTGYYRARTTFPEQARTPSHGRLLAFNAVVGGHPAIFAHVYGEFPTRSISVIVFSVRHPRKGTYGTVLTGKLPVGLSRWGYLKGIGLRLHRNYRYRGRRHTYLAASCAAPAGVNRTSFPFLSTSLAFDDGRTLRAVLSGECHVRE
jgi:hypothetical protein